MNVFSVSTVTLMSSLYTLYKIHPYVPYRFILEYAVVPAFKSLKNKRKVDDEVDNELELYQIVSASEENGIVTRYLMFEEEPQFTFLGVEYVEPDLSSTSGPVFL